MTISIVVPTLNEERNVCSLIEAIRRQTCPADEVLIVDGGSDDATVRLASEFDDVRVLRGKPPVGAQRQLGLQNATGDIVIFLDADTVPPPDFIGRCVKEMEARKLDVACPWYKPHPSSPTISAVFLFFNLLFIALQRLLASGAGGCILAKREFAMRVGGFKSDLVYEDIEFIRRASRRGRFGMIRPSILVSDRRFREFGVGKTLLKYLILSLFFTFGLFRLAGVVSYPFAKYRRGADEMVVLVNENNEPVGAAPKESVHGHETPLHRGFSLFLLNNAGEVLLQQRSRSKQTWPGEWSNSCCGHPMPGESVEDAAVRRAVDELGIRITDPRNMLPDYRYRAEKSGIVENEFCPVLVALTSEEPIPNPSEVVAVRWVRWEEFVGSIEESDVFTPWCREEAKLLNASPEFLRFLEDVRMA